MCKEIDEKSVKYKNGNLVSYYDQKNISINPRRSITTNDCIEIPIHSANIPTIKVNEDGNEKYTDIELSDL